jgi:hypothetical protein
VFLSGTGDLPVAAELEDELTATFGTPTSVRIEYAPTILVSYSDDEGLSRIDPNDGRGESGSADGPWKQAPGWIFNVGSATTLFLLLGRGVLGCACPSRPVGGLS